MYRVDMKSRQLSQIKPVKFSEIGAWERRDIQEWVSKTPEILGEGENGLLILAKELPVNDDLKGIRLDLLALDRLKNLVVIELKRDDARGDVDWQSIKYAARCSRYSIQDLIKLLAEYAFEGKDEFARKAIIEHIEGESDDKNLGDDKVADCFNRSADGLAVRIILIAREFHPDVAAAVLWLRDNQIDISCVRLKPFKDEDEVFLVAEKIIPLPETAHYTDIATSRKSTQNTQQSFGVKSRSVFSTERAELSNEEIQRSLQNTLTRDSDLTPRLIKFLEILIENKDGVKREEMKRLLHEAGIGRDIGQTGRYLSNISQFVTKPNSGHLRQFIDFMSLGDIDEAGAEKTFYKIKDEYQELVKAALVEVEKKVAL